MPPQQWRAGHRWLSDQHAVAGLMPTAGRAKSEWHRRIGKDVKYLLMDARVQEQHKTEIGTELLVERNISLVANCSTGGITAWSAGRAMGKIQSFGDDAWWMCNISSTSLRVVSEPRRNDTAKSFVSGNWTAMRNRWDTSDVSNSFCCWICSKFWTKPHMSKDFQQLQ